MLQVIREDAISESFRIVESPVYVVNRHGGYKRCLSRSAAINNLAHYMVTETFRRADIDTNEYCEPLFMDGAIIHRIGEHTQSYLFAHSRCCRRIRLLLAKKREFKEWQRKHELIKKRYAEHLAKKPT